MPHLLKNNLLEVQVDLPDENYRYSRFDWSGKIVEVKFKGKSISGTEVLNQGENYLLGKGFYNEFGIDAPVGYQASEKGGWFHKIGVGLLKKDDLNYDFRKPYEIQSANFTVLTEKNKMQITCQGPLVNGFAYLLKKEISLLESGFEIAYFLENKGLKTIITNEYNHNFLSVDKTLIGNHYQLNFPFTIKPELFGETVNPEKIVQLGPKEITFTETPKEQFFFSNLSGGELVDAKWTLENKKTNIGISETGNFQTGAINLWGWRHVICPELFIPIHLPVKQSMSWSRRYQIYEIF